MRRLLCFGVGLALRSLILSGQDPVQRFGQGDQPLMRGACQPVPVVHAVEHGAHHIQTLQQGSHGFCLVDPGLLLIRSGILPQRRFQILGDADVIDDQPRGLVAEHPVHPCDGLHQPVPAHWLVDIHRVHRRAVETGQPHVTHDHQLQRVFRVLRPLGQQVTPRLAADMRLPGLRVRGRAGHDDLYQPGSVILRMPVGTQSHDLAVEIHADAAAHADRHSLAIHRLHARLEMGDQIFGHHAQPLFRPDQGFHRRPFALQTLLLAERLVLGQFLDLGIDPGLFSLGQFDPCEAAFVIDRHCRPVFDSAADVVDVDIMAEHGRRIHIGCLNWRAGEADERGVGQRIPQMFGKAIGDLAGLLDPCLEAILAAMCLIRDHHHIAAVGQQRIGRSLFRGELLDGGEHHPTRCPRQRLLQILAAVGLHRCLSDQVAAHGESAEQLVVQIVAVGDDNDGRVFHRRFTHQLPGVESHQQALPRTLGVPDHPCPAVTAGPAGLHRAGHGPLHGMELVITRDDLGDAARRVTIQREILQQRQQAWPGKHPFDEHRHLRRTFRRHIGAIGRAPGHEAFQIGGQRTDARLHPVGRDQNGIGAEQRRDLRLVGLQLVEGRTQRCGLGPRFLHLDHRDRQAVQEHHHIRAAVMAVFDHGELGNGQPVVLVLLRIHQSHRIAADRAIRSPVFHRHTFHHGAMQAAVFLDQRGAVAGDHPPQGIFARILGNLRVQPGNGRAQAPGKDGVGTGRAFRAAAIGAGNRVIQAGIAQCPKMIEKDGFDFGFREGGHGSAFQIGRNKRDARPILFENVFPVLHDVLGINAMPIVLACAIGDFPALGAHKHGQATHLLRHSGRMNRLHRLVERISDAHHGQPRASLVDQLGVGQIRGLRQLAVFLLIFLQRADMSDQAVAQQHGIPGADDQLHAAVSFSDEAISATRNSPDSRRGSRRSRVWATVRDSRSLLAMRLNRAFTQAWKANMISCGGTVNGRFAMASTVARCRPEVPVMDLIAALRKSSSRARR